MGPVGRARRPSRLRVRPTSSTTPLSANSSRPLSPPASRDLSATTWHGARSAPTASGLSAASSERRWSYSRATRRFRPSLSREASAAAGTAGPTSCDRRSGRRPLVSCGPTPSMCCSTSGCSGSPMISWPTPSGAPWRPGCASASISTSRWASRRTGRTHGRRRKRLSAVLTLAARPTPSIGSGRIGGCPRSLP